MLKKNGMETITSKRVVTWLKMNGFTITIIRAGSTSKQMVLMQNKEWHGNYYLKVGGYMAKSEWFYDTQL